jgi:hypothetical protein
MQAVPMGLFVILFVMYQRLKPSATMQAVPMGLTTNQLILHFP